MGRCASRPGQALPGPQGRLSGWWATAVVEEASVAPPAPQGWWVRLSSGAGLFPTGGTGERGDSALGRAAAGKPEADHDSLHDQVRASQSPGHPCSPDSVSTAHCVPSTATAAPPFTLISVFP